MRAEPSAGLKANGGFFTRSHRQFTNKFMSVFECFFHDKHEFGEYDSCGTSNNNENDIFANVFIDTLLCEICESTDEDADGDDERLESEHGQAL